MSRSSSISSSRYLAAAVLSAAVVLALVSAACFHLKWRTSWTEAGAVLRFQEARLAAAPPFDTVLIGDSSLGNAIDEEVFGQATGTRAVNLALTGRFAYAGSYNMLRRALERGPVRNVVLFHTTDIMSGPFGYDAYVLSAPDADLGPFEPRVRWEMVKAFASQTLDHQVLRRRYIPVFEGDYIRQGTEAAPFYHSPPPRPEHVYFLRQIVRLCRERRLNCLYVVGPLGAPKVVKNRGMIADTSALVRQSGVTMVNDWPMVMPVEDVGDSADHVKPALKAAYTRRYAALIAPHLAPKASP